MKLEYLGKTAYMHRFEECAFLFGTDKGLSDLRDKKVLLLGTGHEAFIAKTLLEDSGVAVSEYLDNYPANVGKILGNAVIRRTYDEYRHQTGHIVIAVPKAHINEVRLQLMMYGIGSYSIFFLENCHIFAMENPNLYQMIMENIYQIGLAGREPLEAVPYVQISSGLDGAKLGILNYLLMSTTWSHHIYQWLYEIYANNGIGRRALEIGPGHGLLSAVFLQMAPGLEMDWITFDSKDVARREINENYDRSLQKIMEIYPGHKVNWKKGYIESDAYELTEEYDVIIMTEVLEHFVVNPKATMKKIADSLKPKGRLFITTPDWGHLYTYESYKEMPTYREINSEETYLSMYAGHTYQYDKKELDEIFADAGLVTMRYAVSDGNNHSYMLEKVS